MAVKPIHVKAIALSGRAMATPQWSVEPAKKTPVEPAF
jgi:hypothetical protein